MDLLEDIVMAYVTTRKKVYYSAALQFLIEEEAEKEEISQRRKFRLDLQTMSDKTCKDYFRFTKSELVRLKAAFRIPEQIKTEDGSIFQGDEALCILLRRLSYPNRLVDLNLLFGRNSSQISQIFNYMLKYIERDFGFLTDSMDLFWLQPNYLLRFAQSISAKGSPLDNCVGFIDGTLRPMCRPGEYQKVTYNGHKRVHGIKFQSVVTPNGLVSNLFGPLEGSRHDSYMLAESGLLPKLEILFNRGADPPYCLYGDPAYPIRPELIAPFKGALNQEQQAFNSDMSKVRQTVEWEYGRIISNFAFCDFKKNLKLRLQPISLYYKVATILSNCHTCLNGSQTSMYFQFDPPTLEEYVNNQRIY